VLTPGLGIRVTTKLDQGAMHQRPLATLRKSIQGKWSESRPASLAVSSPEPHVRNMSTEGKHRLAAVWFADIVGYTDLSSRDEKAALRVVNELQRQVRTT